MSDKSAAKRGFFRRFRRHTEGQGNLASMARDQTQPSEYRNNECTVDVVNLRPVGSEGWPWSNFHNNEPSRTLRLATSLPMLQTADASSWPWTEEVMAETEALRKKSEAKHDSGMDVLDTASQQSFQPPPRSQVEEYRYRALPSTPHRQISDQEPAAVASLDYSARRSSDPVRNHVLWLPNIRSARHSQAIQSAVEETEEALYRSDEVSPELKWHTRNWIISEQQSTWVSRIENRAKNDMKSRDLLNKKE